MQLLAVLRLQVGVPAGVEQRVVQVQHQHQLAPGVHAIQVLLPGSAGSGARPDELIGVQSTSLRRALRVMPALLPGSALAGLQGISLRRACEQSTSCCLAALAQAPGGVS